MLPLLTDSGFIGNLIIRVQNKKNI